MRRIGCWIGFASMMLAVTMQAASGLALEVGQLAPALVAQEFDGHPFDLASERGKVVIIHFWATWCPSCRTEMPILEGVYDRDHNQGLDLIGLSLDRPHDKDEAIKTMRAFSFPAAMLDDAETNGFGQPGTLPLTLIIDRAGVVRVAHTPEQPPLTEATLAAAVAPLLAEPASSRAAAEAAMRALEAERQRAWGAGESAKPRFWD